MVSLTSYIPHGLTLYVVTVQVKMWPGGNKWSSVWRYRLLQLRSLFDMTMVTDFFIFLGLPPWSKFGTQVNNLACPHLPHWNTFIEATPNCFTDQELILSGLLHVCNEHIHVFSIIMKMNLHYFEYDSYMQFRYMRQVHRRTKYWLPLWLW